MAQLDAPQGNKLEATTATKSDNAIKQAYDGMEGNNHVFEPTKDALAKTNDLFGNPDDILKTNTESTSKSGAKTEAADTGNTDTTDDDNSMEGIMVEPAGKPSANEKGSENSAKKEGKDGMEGITIQKSKVEGDDGSRQIPQDDTDYPMTQQELLDGLEGRTEMEQGEADLYNSKSDRPNDRDSNPVKPTTPHPEEDGKLQHERKSDSEEGKKGDLNIHTTYDMSAETFQPDREEEPRDAEVPNQERPYMRSEKYNYNPEKTGTGEEYPRLPADNKQLVIPPLDY